MDTELRDLVIRMGRENVTGSRAPIPG